MRYAPSMAERTTPVPPSPPARNPITIAVRKAAANALRKRADELRALEASARAREDASKASARAREDEARSSARIREDKARAERRTNEDRARGEARSFEDSARAARRVCEDRDRHALRDARLAARIARLQAPDATPRR